MALATYFSHIERQLSSSSECSWPSSVSEQEAYTQIHRRRWKWKKVMKKVIEGSRKSIYGHSKPLKFKYDVVSYSLNFDEGVHFDEYDALKFQANASNQDELN